jgi:excinuclease ABC subunit A
MVMLYPQDARINVLAPFVRGRKGEFKKEIAGLRGRGFTKARIDGQFRSLEEDIKLDRRRNHNIDVVVDRLIVRGGIERRLTESIDVALNLADDIVVINSYDEADRLFSRRLACVDCGLSMPEMTPRAFSFNSPHGACTACQGLGAMVDFDPRRVVPNESRSLADGAIAAWARGDRKLVREALQGLGRDFGIDLTVPFGKLPRKHREVVLFGAGKSFEGILPNLRRRYDEGTWAAQAELEPAVRSLRPCACGGRRLKAQSLSVRVKGRTIAEYVELPIAEALRVVDGLQLTDREAIIAGRILREIQDRLRFLNDAGRRLSDDWPERGDAFRGRRATDPPGDPDRRQSDGRAVCARRAFNWAPSARQPQAPGDARARARPRQHGHRRRTRRRDDPDRRLRDRSRSRRG